MAVAKTPSILIALVVIAIVMMRLPLYVIELAGLAIFGAAFIHFGITIVFRILMGKESYLEQQAQREITELNAGLKVIEGKQGDYLYRSNKIAKKGQIIPLDFLTRPYNGTVDSDAFIPRIRQQDLRVTSSNQPLLLSDNTQPSLLNASLKFDRVLLLGGSGSGKTSFMQHFVANKHGGITVCDPDDDRNTWPSNAVVVGGGEDFEAIETELASFVAEKKKRYELRFQGQEIFEPIYLVLDEWYKIIQKIDGGKYLKEMLISLRKVNMGVLVLSQSDRAGALGLTGNFDLMSSFEAVVRLKGTTETGISATINTGDRAIEVIHPGPYTHAKILASPERSYSLVVPNLDPREAKILELWDKGERRITYISKAIKAGFGGNQSDDVRDILKKHSRL